LPPATNLPAALTSFVGREREVVEVRRLLGTTRLLTLTGTGGVGKTRLALEVARAVAGEYPDGLWLVELATLVDPALVSPTVVLTLGVREEPGHPILDTLVAAVRARRLLLVLDNCEHVIGACARLVEALLHACPALRVLATSREALGIGGEVRWRVPSLPAPAPDPTWTVAQVSQYEAVRLFIERAVAALPGFAVTDRTAPAVAQICHRLDGIPLAIELAASRVAGLGVEQLAARLDQRFRLLTGGSRTALPRQQTLRAAVDWSYDLLTAAERTLFARLAVFVGGFTPEAVEAVCGTPGAVVDELDGRAGQPPAADGLQPTDVLELLLRLVDKSLVVAEAAEGVARYHLLETVRDYARERLAATGAAAALQERHARHYLALAEAGAPELRGRRQVEWMRRLEAERDNVRAVLRWAVENDRAAVGMRLAAALRPVWMERGTISEERAQVEELLARPSGRERTPTRAAALYLAGLFASWQGDYPIARERYRESLAIGRETGDRTAVASALLGLGIMTREQGDLAAARALLEDGLAAARDAGDRSALGVVLLRLGELEQDQGHDEAARARFQESLAIARERGDRRMTASSLSRLGRVAHRQRRFAEAHACYDEAVQIWQGFGGPRGHAWNFYCLAVLAHEQGDAAAARAGLVTSLTMSRDLGDRPRIALTLEALAGVAAARRRAEGALRLAGAAAALRARIASPPAPADADDLRRWLQPARTRLREAAQAAAWAARAAMTLEQAVAEALADEPAAG
jgi:non-specific serine/threonine protein kinase